MAKIYSSPEEIKSPSFNGDWQKEEERYLDEVKALLLKHNPNGKNVGETISFPVADSSAVYMVASMKPLALVHLEIGDAWDFRYVHLMTAKEVQENIDRGKAMAKLFS